MGAAVGSCTASPQNNLWVGGLLGSCPMGCVIMARDCYRAAREKLEQMENLGRAAQGAALVSVLSVVQEQLLWSCDVPLAGLLPQQGDSLQLSHVVFGRGFN